MNTVAGRNREDTSWRKRLLRTVLEPALIEAVGYEEGLGRTVALIVTSAAALEFGKWVGFDVQDAARVIATLDDIGNVQGGASAREPGLG